MERERGDEAEAIDVVVAWVDGNDPAHGRKRERYGGGRVHPHSGGAARFEEAGELLYCLRSVFAFVPFVRRVHVITDDQVPLALERIGRERPEAAGRLRLVDHAALFEGFEGALPTFNSRTIETMLHRVPGLAECFVYLNDDVVLARPLEPDAFFQNGLPVHRGQWRRLRLHLPVLRSKRAGNARGQERGARLAGYRWRYAHAGHVPHPMRRLTLSRFFEARPDVLERQVAHRFRSPEQFLPTALARHLELRGGAPLLAPDGEGYARPDTPPERLEQTLRSLWAGEYRSFCVQELSAFEPDARGEVRQALDALLPG